MSKKKAYTVGLVMAKADLDRLRGWSTETLLLEELDVENQIIHWAHYDNIQLSLYITRDSSQELEEKLLDFLLSEKFIDNRYKINLSFVYDLGYREIALDLFCKCKEKKIPIKDVISKENAISEEIPRVKEIFDFLKVYYDVEAISSEIVRGEVGFVPADLDKAVHKRGYIPEKFWYWHEESSILWQKLTSPKSNYRLTEETFDLLKKNFNNILEIIEKEQTLKTVEIIDFIDLGVGTPEKDALIIRNTMECMKNGSRLVYYPVDISFPLIEYTLRWIIRIKKDRQSRNYLDIKPILGDFEKLNEVDYQTIMGADRPKLIALLGNTLGNLKEDKSFDTISSIIGEKGYLLIDVEFSDDVDDTTLKKQYYTEEMYNFVFHPLELLGYEKGSFGGNMEVNVLAGGKILYDYGGNQRLTVSSVPGNKVISMLYRTPENKQILMAWSTKYCKRDFDEFVSKRFKISGEWHDNSKRYGLYLLKKLEGGIEIG
jgi:hypothetical protein